MSIASEITRLNNAKAAIKKSLANKGVEVSDSALLDEYPALIDSIEVGSGEGGDPLYEVYWNHKTKNNTSYYETFYGYKGTELDVSKLDTSQATTMYNMFYSCSYLTTLDVSNFDTSNVTNMYSMFYNCSKLTTLDVSNFDTNNVTNMSSMFNNCGSLTTLDLSNFDTSNVTNMSSMFFGCSSLTALDVSNFDTSNVTNMSSMFSICTRLTELNISNFDMTNVTNVTNMFRYCNSLHTLRLDYCSNDTINKIITSSNFPTDAIEGVTRTIYCKEENAAGLTAPTNWVFSYITEEPPVEDIPLYVPGEFNNKGNITEARTMVNDTHTSLRNMFDCCFNLASIIGIEDWDTSNVTSMYYMFNYCHKLTTLDLSAWNTSKVTDMYRMFACCSNLTTVDLSNFDMTNVTSLMGMFDSCYELHTVRLDNCSNDTISKIVTSAGLPTGTVNGEIRKIYCKEENITGLTAPNGWVFVDYMTGEEIVPEMPEEPDVPLYVPGQFENKSEITEVNTMVNDTHTDLRLMFGNCINLTTINGIEKWDTSNVTDMSAMFNYDAKLITLDLSSFNTSKVTDMSFMFNYCSNLEEVDLRNFDIRNTTSVNAMFNGCYELHTVRLDNCNNTTISKITTSTFLPTGTVNGTTRIIYCKEENVAGLTAPNGWEFVFVD